MMTEEEIKIKVCFECIFSEIQKLNEHDLDTVVNAVNKNLDDRFIVGTEVVQHQYIIDLLILEKTKTVK